jgi:hypothetical protein
MKEKKITTANSTNIPSCTYTNIYRIHGAILSCSFDCVSDGGHSVCQFKPPD